MKTKFIKVSKNDELPDFGQRVIALVLEQNDLGLSKFLWNVSYDDNLKVFRMDGNIVSIEYWLKEVPDNEDELIEAISRIKNIIEDFPEWDEETLKLTSLIQKVKSDE